MTSDFFASFIEFHIDKIAEHWMWR